MAERVYLHIGAPKSGTTYLQSVLWQSRAALAADGLLVPGKQLVDFNMAAAAVRKRKLGKGRPARTWRRLVRRCRRWDGTAVMSAEWFCLTPENRIGRMVRHLAPAEVHVVYTARALAPMVTAAWQESLKTGHREALPEFVAAMDDPDRRWSWRSVDPVEVLGRWQQHVPAERIHVVTVPPPGSDPELLLRRFAQVVGFDPARADTSAARPNESLSVEAAELVRRVSPRIDEIVGFSDLKWPERYRWLRRYFAHGLMVPLPGHPIALDDTDAKAIAARAERAAAALGSAGYDIVGDLADIVHAPRRPDAVRPADVSDSAMLELAVPVMAELVARIREVTTEQETRAPRPARRRRQAAAKRHERQTP
jgi:hypothetical protein